MSRPHAKELIKGVVKAALELACLRNNLCYEDEPPIVVEQCAELVSDTFNAMYGIDTCSEEPCPEVLALEAGLAADPVRAALVEALKLVKQDVESPDYDYAISEATKLRIEAALKLGKGKE